MSKRKYLQLRRQLVGAMLLTGLDIPVDIRPDYGYRGIRSYRVSTEKIEETLGFRPSIGIRESVQHMIENIRKYNYTDFDNPIYHNIKWMKLLEEASEIVAVTGSVF